MKKAHDIRPFGVRFVWCEVISSSFLFGAFFSSLGSLAASLPFQPIRSYQNHLCLSDLIMAYHNLPLGKLARRSGRHQLHHYYT
jgi:hypothetical protein